MENKSSFLRLIKFKLMYLGVIFISLYLSITGADCADILFGAGGIDGSWQLVGMRGDAQDVCLLEVAQFNSGVATLQCPNASPRTRNYTFNNNVLTFTETNVTYNATFQTTNGTSQMVLNGVNVDRTLTYNRTSSDRVPPSNEKDKNSSNSSELSK